MTGKTASNQPRTLQNPVRNRASVAHPNSALLAVDEAMLVVNIARTLLAYFDGKLGGA